MPALLPQVHLYAQTGVCGAGTKNSGSRIVPLQAKCLFNLSWLFEAVGNNQEYKNFSGCALGLRRKEGNEAKVAETLQHLLSEPATLFDQ